MNRLLLLALLAAACTSRPAIHGGAGGSAGSSAGSGGAGGEGGLEDGGTGGLDDGGSGGALPIVCIPGERRWCLREDTTAAQRNVGTCRDGSQLCADGSAWTPCAGGIGPEEEPLTCDGLDQDCDGAIDGPPVLPCRWCGTGLEVCGNALDDDCDGRVDPASSCHLTCLGDAIACCHEGPGGTPQPHSFRCVESPELPACASDERWCLDLDDDLDTRCVKSCAAAGCTCGAPGPDGPVESPTCGFETPCARLGCEGRTDQPCYSGFAWNLGVGICHGGVTSCVDGAWGACEEEQLPLNEICGNGLDDDCDGLIDEDDGPAHRRCPPVCRPDAEVCNAADDDCDGFVDETCTARGIRDCYAGPPETRGVGTCRDGRQRAELGWWSVCTSAGPAAERCGDGLDTDCNGRGGPGEPEDPGCCVPTGPETCNGLDDDCDGLVDDGVVNACGTCGGECFEVEIQEPGACASGTGRICDRVIPDENGTDWITISSDARGPVGPNVLYATLAGGDVIQVDPITGQRGWRGPGHVDRARFVAVALDGSAWIGGSTVSHLDRDGNLICSADAGPVTGIALDTWGDLLVLTQPGVVYRVSGTVVLPPARPGGPAACALAPPVPGVTAQDGFELSVAADGIAISSEDVLWTGSSPSVRLDLETGEAQLVKHPASSGLTLDPDGNAWFGGREVHRVLADGPYEEPALYAVQTGIVADRLSADEDGYVWGLAAGTDLVRIDPITLEGPSHRVPGYSVATAPDGAGKVWAVGRDDALHRFDPVNRTWDSFDGAPGEEIEVSGDITGRAHFTMKRNNEWTQVLDSGWASAQWLRLRWDERVPAGTRLDVFARFAGTQDSLFTETPCRIQRPAPGNLTQCPGEGKGRWIAITIRMRAGPEGAKPLAGDISVSWTRP